MNNYKFLVATIFTCISLSFASFSYANLEDAKQLALKLDNFNSLESEFTQITIDAKGMRVQESSGLAKIAKPNKMQWFTKLPYEQLLVTNGKKMWLYEKDLEQVSVENLDTSIQATPALILFENSKNLDKNFDVEYRKSKSIETFILTPKTKDTLYETITFTFTQGKLSKINLQDSLNQKTIIRFKNSNFDVKFKSSDFEFEIPKGVDVIDRNSVKTD